MAIALLEKTLRFTEFNRKKAIASLDEGKPVIPVWLDVIDQQLNKRLNERNESA
ncbi:hypothetical protein [Nostoc sp.]